MVEKKSSSTAEFILFEAFIKNNSFEEAKEKLEKSDDKIIVDMLKDKKSIKALEQSYDLFRDALSELNSSSDMESLKDNIRYKMHPCPTPETVKTSSKSSSIEKINVGSLLMRYHRFLRDENGEEKVKDYKKQEKRYMSQIRHEQATTYKYGNVQHGGYDKGSVISTKSGDYKPIAKKIKEDKFEM